MALLHVFVQFDSHSHNELVFYRKNLLENCDFTTLKQHQGEEIMTEGTLNHFFKPVFQT